MGRRNEHTREQQFEMAVSAAELLIVKEGMSGFSMRKVARAIGYTVGQLYLVFKNQDDLLAAVNARTADAILSCLQDALAEAPPGVDALHALAGAYIDYAQRHPKRWALMYEHKMPEGAPAPKANLLRVGRIFELAEQTLGVAMPTIPSSQLRELTTALWSGVHGICVLAVSGKLVWSGVTDYHALTRVLIERFVVGEGRN